MPVWVGGVSVRLEKSRPLSVSCGSLVALVLFDVLFSIRFFAEELWAMLVFPPCSLFNSITTELTLVRLVLLQPVGHLVEFKGEGELAIFIGVAHRFGGCFPFSFALGFGFCSLSLSVACGELALKCVHEGFKVNAVIHIDFGCAF